jgi:thiol-disulfide isomerase/thioredoxin
VKQALLLALLSTLLACGASKDNTNEPDLDSLRGQWVVINYWAQWCKPCIKEIPELNMLDQQYPEVTVLGVNYDGTTGEDLAAQLEKLGIEFATLATDPASQLGTPRPVVLPTTLILDPAGQLSVTLVGPQTLTSLAQATGQTGDNPPHE